MDETVTSHRNQDESFLPRSTNANCYEAEPTSYRPCGNSPPTGSSRWDAGRGPRKRLTMVRFIW